MTNHGEDSIGSPKEETKSLKIDLNSYSVKGNGKCFPIYNLIVTGASIALFYFGNVYFLDKIEKVIDGSVASIPTESFSCQNYYCSDVANNFINYYSYFEECNVANCAPTCLYYSCLDDNANSNLNLYYSCQKTKCGEWSENVPSEIKKSHAMTVANIFIFSVALLIGIVYGVSSALLSENLYPIEKIALYLTFIWPSFKYYAFRRREYWQDFEFDFRRMVIVDIIIGVFYISTIGLCFSLKSNSYWWHAPEMACYYLLFSAVFERIFMIINVGKPFFVAGKSIEKYKSLKNM